MRSGLNKEIADVLEKHGCSSFFVMMLDPDSNRVYTTRGGTSEWIYGELARAQNKIKIEWTNEDFPLNNDDDDDEGFTP